VLTAKVAGIVEATALETTAQCEGCGQATRNRRHHNRLGRDPAVKVTALNRIVHVVTDRAVKQEAVNFFGERFLRLYNAWGHQNVAGLDNASRSLAQVSQDHFIIGEAAECVELIAQYAALGIGEIACLMNVGGPDLAAVERSMQLFAERVMSCFATG
jgi:alkanesulfonate monooxygenase SsuD/methylene tetrahydromethanopterin reductase-like flavin-dependent oxidoreductase (luciferase family)